MCEYPEDFAAVAHPQVAVVLRNGTGTAPDLLARLLVYVGPTDADPEAVAGLVYRCVLDPTAEHDPALARLREMTYLTPGSVPLSSRLLAASNLLRQLATSVAADVEQDAP